jgi:hypothetical protein
MSLQASLDAELSATVQYPDSWTGFNRQAPAVIMNVKCESFGDAIGAG